MSRISLCCPIQICFALSRIMYHCFCSCDYEANIQSCHLSSRPWLADALAPQGSKLRNHIWINLEISWASQNMLTLIPVHCVQVETWLGMVRAKLCSTRWSACGCAVQRPTLYLLLQVPRWSLIHHSALCYRVTYPFTTVTTPALCADVSSLIRTSDEGRVYAHIPPHPTAYQTFNVFLPYGHANISRILRCRWRDMVFPGSDNMFLDLMRGGWRLPCPVIDFGARHGLTLPPTL